MDKVYTLDEIKNIAGEIAKRHGVERMFLFGSYARRRLNQIATLISALIKEEYAGCSPLVVSMPI